MATDRMTSKNHKTEWAGIESAPRDQIILLTDGIFVHPAFYDPDHSGYVWRLLDSMEAEPQGCCEFESNDRMQVNAAKKEWPTHWMPLPSPPDSEA